MSDIVVVGGGPNGLACALVLARSGLSVRLFESKPAAGGGFRIEHRLGLVPKALGRLLNVKLPLEPRSPRALETDGELDALLDDLEPAWLAPPLGPPETAERYLRPALRAPFLDLLKGSAASHLSRVGLSDAAILVDALRASASGPDDAGSGAALLARRAAARPDGGGDAVPVESFDAVTRVLADAARAAGAVIETATVQRILVEGNSVAGVVLDDGRDVRAASVACSADPLRLRAMTGEEHFSAEWNAKVDALVPQTSVCRMFFSLGGSLPDAHRGVRHLVPGGLDAVRVHVTDARANKLPSAPCLELVVDGSLASVWIPWAPYDLAGTTWAAEEEAFAARVLAQIDALVPGFRALVTETTVLHPKKLETQFGITRGHPHHVDDAMIFGDRLAHATPVQGLYACGAGCAPIGGAFGLPGRNAAKKILDDFDLALERTDVSVRRPG